MAGCPFPALMTTPTSAFMASVNLIMASPPAGERLVFGCAELCTSYQVFIKKFVSYGFLYFHRCDSGYTGTQCEEIADFNILYVVPSGQKLHYVLIAAIIGAVQIAIIVAVVMCITR